MNAVCGGKVTNGINLVPRHCYQDTMLSGSNSGMCLTSYLHPRDLIFRMAAAGHDCLGGGKDMPEERREWLVYNNQLENRKQA